MEDANSYDRSKRRRDLSLSTSFLVLVTYLGTTVVTIIARLLGVSSITSGQIWMLSLAGIGITSCYIVALFLTKTVTTSVGKAIYFSQFGIWLMLFTVWVSYLNEPRVIGLILAVIALSFMLSTTSLVVSMAISMLICLCYSLGAYWGIFYLGQDGSLTMDLYYVGCFLPSAGLISYMAGRFNAQKKAVKISKDTAEQSLAALRKVIKFIAEKCQPLNDQSEDLLSLSADMNDNVENITVKTKGVVSASNEMSDKTNIVADTINDASENIISIAASVEEITVNIHGISEGSEKAKTISGQAVTQSGAVSEKVQQLGAAAQEIGKVTEVISEISDQINLLSLNATIEAARAGDSGRGFAVVANEIKELARQTDLATQQIKQQIIDIQTATTESVEAILRNAEVINNIDEIISTINVAIEDQSKNTGEIARNVALSSQVISSVKENAVQTSAVAKDIAAAIAEVNQDVGAISGNSTHVHQSANHLLELAKGLKELTEEYAPDAVSEEGEYG